MIHEGRRAPVVNQQEVVVGTEYASLGHSLLTHFRREILELLDNQVISVNREVKALIVIDNSLRSMEVTELINGSAELMVTIVLTTIADVIARVVSQHLCWGIDTRTHGTTHRIAIEILVCSRQSLLDVCISLIEGINGYDTLLLNVQLVLTGGQSKTTSYKREH